MLSPHNLFAGDENIAAHRIDLPPSTGSATPVMKDDSSLARNNATFAVSVVWPSRFIGMLSAAAFISCSSDREPPAGMNLGSIGVSAATGQIELTRIFCGASSTANDRVSATTAPFDAQ